MARANVPKFGEWDKDGVPYTVCFDKARRNKGGKMINPNDPQENPDMFRIMDPAPPIPTRVPAPAPAPPKAKSRSGELTGRGSVRQFSNSPARSVNESSYGGRGQRPGRSTRLSGGSEQSNERPPLPPQGKVIGRGNEGRKNEKSYDIPGKSWHKPSDRGTDDTLERDVAVPMFGEWDGAEEYTDIFDELKKRKNGIGNPMVTPKQPVYASRNKDRKSNKTRCFPWYLWQK